MSALAESHAYALLMFRLRSRSSRPLLHLCLAFVASGILVASVGVPPITAQESSGEWSGMEVVFQDDSGFAQVIPAVIVADAGGVAHLFWLYKMEKHDRLTWTISYAYWRNGEWSEPNEVLATPGGGAGAPRVVVAEDGLLHSVWADSQRLWYSNSPARTAWDARSWTLPRSIASSALEADIALDNEGRLHAIYTPGWAEGPIFHIQSDDGRTWTEPVTVYQEAPENVTSMHPRITVDGRNRIHVTWTQYQIPAGWPPLGQWYSRSDDNGLTWANTIQLGGRDQGQGSVLAVGDSEVHLVWRGTSGAGNTFHSRSTNGGITWRAPEVFDPDGGFSGPQSLAVDSAGVIHLVRGDGGYQRWEDGSWSPVPALFADSGETGTLAISLGNRVHWVNTTPVSSDIAVVMHRVLLTNAPMIVARDIPVPGLTSEAISEPEPTIEVAPSNAGDGQIQIVVPNREPRVRSPSYAWLIAMMPTGLLIVAAILVARTLRRGNR